MLLPVVAVLMAGNLTPAAVLLTIAALCAFLAHEPAALLLRRRGMRARDQTGVAATAWLAVLSLLGAGSGVLALSSSEAALLGSVAVPLVLGGAAFGLLPLRRERTTAGEVLAAVALASVAMPVGVAAGLSVGTAVVIVLVWAVGLAIATATVRGILRAAKERRSVLPEAATTAAVLVLAIAALLSTVGEVPVWVAPSLCPLAFASVALGAFRPRPAHVRRVGWLLVGANVATLVIVVSGV